MPYNPPEPYNTMFGPLAESFQSRWMMSEDGVILDPENRQNYIDLYDGETAFADNQLRVLFAHLRSTDHCCVPVRASRAVKMPL